MTYDYIYSIDVSKSSLDISLLKQDSREIQSREKIANTIEGIQSWLNQHSTGSTLHVLEYTGTYSDKLINLLS